MNRFLESPLCGDLIFMQADKRIPADLMCCIQDVYKKGICIISL